jgi:hypothetical protein
VAVSWPNAYGDQMGSADVTTDWLSTSGDQLAGQGVMINWQTGTDVQLAALVRRSLGRLGVAINWLNKIGD